MKKLLLAPALFLCAYGFAQTAETAPAAPSAPTARKACEDLKAEITTKLEAKGVKSYSLDIVDKGKEGDAKVVGSCDGGTKSITYTRGAKSEAKPADAKKPE